MAIQFFIEKYKQTITRRTFAGLSRYVIPTDCTITRLDFHAPTIAGEGWKFCVLKNGVPITPSNPTDPAAVTLGESGRDTAKTGLTIAAVGGDVIQVDLIAYGTGSSWAGFEFCATANDHRGGSVAELSDVDLAGNTAGDVLVFNGTLWVAAALPAIPSTLNDLSDVNTAGETNGNFLKYNGSGWVPANVPAPAAPALDDLTDVSTAGETNGNFLKYNGSGWVPANVPAPALDDITNVAAPTPAVGDRLTWDGTNWINEPGADLTFEGDVIGTAGANTVSKIQHRTIENWPLPTFVGDDFDDNSFDTALWDVFKSSDSNFAESSQRLNVTPGANSTFNKTAAFVVKHSFDAYSKEAIAFLNVTPPTLLNSNYGLKVYVGFVRDDVAGIGSFGNLVDNFLGMSTDVILQSFNNHVTNTIYFNKSGDSGDVAGSTSGVTQPTRSITDPWPIGIRVKMDGQNMKCYVMEFGTSSWALIATHAFSSTSLPGYRLCIGVQTTSPSTIGQNAGFDIVQSTATLTDALGDGDTLAWDQPGQKWTNRGQAGIPLVTAAPTTAPSVGAGQTALVYHATTHFLYAWNGASWDKVHLDPA